MAPARRISVTHILTRPELGGAQANTLHTVRSLDRERFSPSLITSPDGPLAGDAAAIEGAEVVFVSNLVREIRPGRDWRAARQIRRLLTVLAPDVVHTHSSKAGILGRWAAHRAGVRSIVHTVHGFPFHDHQPAPARRLYIGLERLAARHTDRFICVSRADVAKGERHRIFPPGRSVLIRSGIDLSAYREACGTGKALRKDLGIPADAPLVGMVACFKPQKDPVAFVRMAAGVRRHRPDVYFLMVGDGELRMAVETARLDEALGDRLVLAGWRRDIPAVMDACTVLVLTSKHEGLPRVVPEAMACGRPVVATAVDGTPEAVDEGVTGHLVTPGDVRALVARTLDLLAAPDVARRMGAAAATRVTEFDIDRMVRQQEDLYTELAAPDRVRPEETSHVRC
ncbi:MAG: glycosyltransferase family 4 protein [Acidobacteriota bacterium]